MGSPATSRVLRPLAHIDSLRGECSRRLHLLCQLHFFGLLLTQCKPVGDRVLQQTWDERDLNAAVCGFSHGFGVE